MLAHSIGRPTMTARRAGLFSVVISLRHVDAWGRPGVILAGIRQAPGERPGLASARDGEGDAIGDTCHAVLLAGRPPRDRLRVRPCGDDGRPEPGPSGRFSDA